MDGWIKNVSFLPIPKMDENCLLEFFHSQHGCKLSGFLHLPTRPCSRPVDECCLFRFFQPDHAPDRRWKLSVLLHPARPSWKAAAAAAAAPRALGIRKVGFRNRDSGIQKEREIDAAGGFVFVFVRNCWKAPWLRQIIHCSKTETKRRRRIKQQQQKKRKKKKKEKKKGLLLLLLHR